MTAPSGVFRSDLITESRGTRHRRCFLLLAALAAAGVPATAQFISGVNVVEVYATVTDRTGTPVEGLGRDAFDVREDGEPQQVATFAAGQFPLAVALAVDRSFSMSGERLGGARSAARTFLEGLRADDESMVVAIGSRTEVVAPLSRDRTTQLAALTKLDAFGTTGLYDAILASLEAIEPARGRRALVLLSDGSDRYSTATAEATLARARSSDVLIYPIALGRARPPAFAELAALTGGRSFHIEDPRKLPETMRMIGAELRSQYLLGYSPSRPPVPGSGEWRAISVTVRRPGLRVRARDGYLVR